MMTMPEIERCLRQLRLSGVRDTLQTRVLQAQGANQPFLETFSLILQDELDRRQSRLIERRYQQSGLDEKLTLAEFDWSFNPKLPRQTCFQLHTLAFIAAGENALLVGKPGTGKSHIAKAIAYQAILQSHKVQYRAGPGCLDSAPLDLSGFLPGYAERGALRFCRCVGRA
ncbi:DNA replication protein DnaC [Bradyrhizobium japonicum]